MISALHAASKEDHWTRPVCDQERPAGLYCVCTALVTTQVPGANVGNVCTGISDISVRWQVEVNPRGERKSSGEEMWERVW